MKIGLPGVLLAALLISFCSGCDQGGTAVVVVGSTSIQPFADELASNFRSKSPEIRAQVQGGGSTAGIEALANGIADIGMCSRSLTPDEQGRFTPILIARDGIAIVVHPSNTVERLSLDQIRGLFSGQITNWKEVGGPDQTVTLITREAGSGTREAFMHLVMKDMEIPANALVQQSNGAVRQLVHSDPGAVGYMSLGMAGHDVKALAVDGVPAKAAHVVDGTYPLSRPFLFVVKGTPKPEAQRFIDFVLSDEGQQLLEKEGLVRAK